MKTSEKVVCAVVVFVCGGVLLPIAQEWLWTMKRNQVRSQIKASYAVCASRGEVAAPATNSDALRCSAPCFWSLPQSVRVKAASGHIFVYMAQSTTNATTPYTFRFISERDAQGNPITNSPSL